MHPERHSSDTSCPTAPVNLVLWLNYVWCPPVLSNFWVTDGHQTPPSPPPQHAAWVISPILCPPLLCCIAWAPTTMLTTYIMHHPQIHPAIGFLSPARFVTPHPGLGTGNRSWNLKIPAEAVEGWWGKWHPDWKFWGPQVMACEWLE